MPGGRAPRAGRRGPAARAGAGARPAGSPAEPSSGPGPGPPPRPPGPFRGQPWAASAPLRRHAGPGRAEGVAPHRRPRAPPAPPRGARPPPSPGSPGPRRRGPGPAPDGPGTAYSRARSPLSRPRPPPSPLPPPAPPPRLAPQPGRAARRCPGPTRPVPAAPHHPPSPDGGAGSGAARGRGGAPLGQRSLRTGSGQAALVAPRVIDRAHGAPPRPAAAAHARSSARQGLRPGGAGRRVLGAALPAAASSPAPLSTHSEAASLWGFRRAVPKFPSSRKTSTVEFETRLLCLPKPNLSRCAGAETAVAFLERRKIFLEGRWPQRGLRCYRRPSLGALGEPTRCSSEPRGPEGSGGTSAGATAWG